jgi:hypothetical protein
MKAIVVSNGQVTVDGATYNSLKYKAGLDSSGLIFIHSDPVGGDVLLYGAQATDVSLNGTTYTSVSQFVADFNSAVQTANLGVNVGKNTSYPDTLISANIVCTTKQQICTAAKSGYVTFTAPSTNTGVIYIGLTGVGATNYPLASGASVEIELANLSLIYVLASVGGESVNVLGAYKS